MWIYKTNKKYLGIVYGLFKPIQSPRFNKRNGLVCVDISFYYLIYICLFWKNDLYIANQLEYQKNRL